MSRHASPLVRRRAAAAGLAVGVVAALGAGFAFTSASAGVGPQHRAAGDRPQAGAHRSAPPRAGAPTPSARPSAEAGTSGTARGALGSSAGPSGAPSGTASARAGAAAAGAGHQVTLPAPGAGFDYQIGGPYTPPPGVAAVSRDRTAPAAAGMYNICYVNAFQAQPDATDWWQQNHPDLLLRDSGGDPVVDQDWHEALLDVSTADKRTRLAAIVGGWIDDCAAKGYQAVEPDNLDSYDRSGGRLSKSSNAAFAELLADRAHGAGLAIGQKNTTAMLDQRTAVGFDFAVAEECGRYGECGAFASAYGNRVFVIEYRAADFDKACDEWRGRLSVVLRDRDVRPAGTSGYVYRRC
ncbi:endo alpha-1,4 polygalactosaminidase [Kitasatospora paranensis]|uniref:Endo alpha-1,4 polygalactosaminidase n=1 Tax=Kitasatospora paranensis TaxID=258053 RepID=A0ABW2FQ92_9ACTN